MSAPYIPQTPLGGWGLLRALRGYQNAGQDLFSAGPAQAQAPAAPPRLSIFQKENPNYQDAPAQPAQPLQMDPMNVAAPTADKTVADMSGKMHDATPRLSFMNRLLEGALNLPRDGSVSQEDRAAMRRQGLLALSTSLLRGPQAGQPNNLFSMLGTAIPGAQDAAMGGLQQRDALQQRAAAQQVRGLLAQTGGDASPAGMRRALGILMASGNVQGAKELAEAYKSMRPDMHYASDHGTTQVFGDGQLMGTYGPDEHGLAPEEVVHALDPLYQRYHEDTSDLAGKAAAHAELQSTAQAMLNPRIPATQKGAMATQLVYAFVRSMVSGAGRMNNTEIQQAINSGSLPQQIMNKVDRILNGTLDDEFVRSISRAAETAGRDQMQAYDRTRADYTRQAQAMGIPDKYVSLPDAWSQMRSNWSGPKPNDGGPPPAFRPVRRSNIGRN